MELGHHKHRGFSSIPSAWLPLAKRIWLEYFEGRDPLLWLAEHGGYFHPVEKFDLAKLSSTMHDAKRLTRYKPPELEFYSTSPDQPEPGDTQAEYWERRARMAEAALSELGHVMESDRYPPELAEAKGKIEKLEGMLQLCYAALVYVEDGEEEGELVIPADHQAYTKALSMCTRYFLPHLNRFFEEVDNVIEGEEEEKIQYSSPRPAYRRDGPQDEIGPDDIPF